MSVRAGTVAALVLLAALLFWTVRGGLSRPRSGGLVKAEQTAGGRVTAGATQQADISPADKKLLLGLARRTLEQVVRHGTVPAVPREGVPRWMLAPSGCFVTLEKEGQLRGCIGHIHPQEPLIQAVIQNARSAALRDPRFSPVTPPELEAIEVEVSVLTVPAPLAFESPADLLRKLRPHVDGVVLTVGARRATFLPQVWEKLPTRETFMQHLSSKAGLGADGWRSPEARVSTYQARAFKERERVEGGQAEEPSRG